MADEPENLVLATLRRLETKVDKMGDDIATHGSVLSGPTRSLNILQQDTRLIRAAVNDIAKVDVTAGEVEALHHDVNRLQQEVSELVARVEAIESREPDQH